MKQADAQTQFTVDVTAHCQHSSTLEEQAKQEEGEYDFASFFTQSLDLLCIAGLDGYFKRLNPAWTTHLGWTLEELEAKPFLDFVHPDDREATEAEVVKLAAGAVTIQFENRYRHRDGGYRWLQWTSWPVPGNQQIYATARDVTRQKRLEREVLEIVDQEKERLGRELHDGLCQTLAGIAALSSTLSSKLAAHAEPDASAAAAEITNLLKTSMSQARDLARGLTAVGLKEAGLDGALENLALVTQHLFRVSSTFANDRLVPRLRPEVEAHLFRIAQEAVNNAVIHARADGIEIRLSCRNGKGLLSILDDGVGVPDRAGNPEGLGMHTMAYRARMIGGSLQVRRRSRKGTAVACAFPLQQDPDTHEEPARVRDQD